MNPTKSGSRRFRVVVQHVKAGEAWSYRLIAYEDGETHRPVSFVSLEELVRALHSALPTFPADELQPKEGATATYIAYTGEWEMNDSQIARLGFEDN